MSRTSLLTYSETETHYEEFADVAKALGQLRPKQVNWLTLSGLTLQDDFAAVQRALAHFNVDPALADAFFRPEQAPFEGERQDGLIYDYAILLYRPHSGAHARVTGSLILGPDFVLLFEKIPSGVFERARRKILGRQTRAQLHGADFLFGMLIQAVIVNYQEIHRALEAKFEKLEDDVIGHPAREIEYDHVLKLREEFSPLYSYLVDLKDFVKAIREDETHFIKGEAKRLFTRVLSRETEALLADQQHLRSWLAELIEIHRANVNESTNRVMKTLTVISTIFLPLTFIAGVYGMNFIHMPELAWEWAYPAVMAFMTALAAGALIYMRSKRWI